MCLVEKVHDPPWLTKEVEPILTSRAARRLRTMDVFPSDALADSPRTITCDWSWGLRTHTNNVHNTKESRWVRVIELVSSGCYGGIWNGKTGSVRALVGDKRSTNASDLKKGRTILRFKKTIGSMSNVYVCILAQASANELHFFR